MTLVRMYVHGLQFRSTTAFSRDYYTLCNATCRSPPPCLLPFHQTAYVRTIEMHCTPSHCVLHCRQRSHNRVELFTLRIMLSSLMTATPSNLSVTPTLPTTNHFAYSPSYFHTSSTNATRLISSVHTMLSSSCHDRQLMLFIVTDKVYTTSMLHSLFVFGLLFVMLYSKAACILCVCHTCVCKLALLAHCALGH